MKCQRAPSNIRVGVLEVLMLYLSRDTLLTTGTGKAIKPNNMDLKAKGKVVYSSCMAQLL